jgi:hypothetical protein
MAAAPSAAAPPAAADAGSGPQGKKPSDTRRPAAPKAAAADHAPEKPAQLPAKPKVVAAGNAQAPIAAAPAQPEAPASPIGTLFRKFVQGGEGAPPAPAASDPSARAGGARSATVAAASPSPQGAQPQAAAPAAAPGRGSVSVKLASSTSENGAREMLAQLQRKFPGALAGGGVYREDLGKFGVFYRVRVPGLSHDAADKICSELKAGGTGCTLSGG